MMYRSMFSERRVIGWAKGEIPDEPNDGLDEGPARGWLQQFHNNFNSVVLTHGVLSHLSFDVTRGQVAESANRWFRDFFAITCVDDRAHQSIHSADLAYSHLSNNGQPMI